MEHPLVQMFNSWLLSKSWSDRTRINYVALARRYMEAYRDVEEPFGRWHVLDYIAGLGKRGHRGKTQQWAYYGLKKFFVVIEKPWPCQREDCPKREKRPTNVPLMTPEVSEAMEDVAKRRGLKEYALVRLERTLGLRRIELQQVNISNFNPDTRKLRVPTAKEGDVVDRTVDPKTATIISRWVAALRRRSSRPDKDALFIRGNRGPRLSLSGLSYLFRKIKEEAEIEMDGAGYHSMRRGRVTDLHDEGFTETEITAEFGWISDNTVKTYIKPSKERVEKKIRKIDRYHQERPDEFDRAAAVADEVEAMEVEAEEPEEAEPTGAHPSRYVRDEQGRIIRPET